MEMQSWDCNVHHMETIMTRKHKKDIEKGRVVASNQCNVGPQTAYRRADSGNLALPPVPTHMQLAPPSPHAPHFGRVEDHVDGSLEKALSGCM